jgi:hypothetical protein
MTEYELVQSWFSGIEAYDKGSDARDLAGASGWCGH